jgi:hypothetical protein
MRHANDQRCVVGTMIVSIIAVVDTIGHGGCGGREWGASGGEKAAEVVARGEASDSCGESRAGGVGLFGRAAS